MVDLVDGPHAALEQLSEGARAGTLAALCRQVSIDMLVVFGSAVDPAWPAPPRDLDLAVLMGKGTDLLRVVDALMAYLGFENIDVMDLDRAGIVARAQALGRGKLLYEAEHGTFAERQILAFVQHADTQWMRDIQLEALAR